MSRRQATLEKQINERLHRVETLEAENATLLAENAKLLHRVETLEAENAALRAESAKRQAENKDLKRQLNQNSSNSSKPPSTDPPGHPPRKKRQRGLRKPGGQPGHEGRARELLPPEQVDEIQDHRPPACRGCGKKLRGDDPSPQRHQVAELPQVQPTVVEHRLHCLECACGVRTSAELPAGVPMGAFGPRVQGLVGLLTGGYRISKRNAVQLLADCFGLQISVGSIKRIEDDLSQHLAVPVEAAREHVRSQPVVGMDETIWWQGVLKAWLWTAVTPLVVVFLIRFSRGAKVAREILGEGFKGLILTDRWSSYAWVDAKRRQLCWAHLKRDFQEIAEAGGNLAAIGEALLAREKQLFVWWHRLRDGTLVRSAFQAHVGPLRAEVCDLLRQGAALTDQKLSGMCAEILKLEVAMWTFVAVEGVEPTNNQSEQVLRHAVIWRKTSFGTQSDAGTTFVERILTTVGTLRLQKRNVLDYLVDVGSAALQGTAPPSLLPAAMPDCERAAG